jgi:hypothetical protein
MNYQDFIASKEIDHIKAGFDAHEYWTPDQIMEFQYDIVMWACRRGRSALLADTGLGKTLMQLTWAKIISEHEVKPVLILSPLCVAQQTVREGTKFGIEAVYMRIETDTSCKIHVTNYEMLKNFNPAHYSGIVVDESSILKGMNGKTRQTITDFAKTIPYRLSCTATPSPNDFMELGTQSEFLGIMSQVEMLATFFIHDGADTSKWRLKGHARRRFWEWIATWACVVRDPSDLGYTDAGYDLPPLNLIEHVIETAPTSDMFPTIAQGLQDRNQARRESIDARCAKAADLMKDWNCAIAWTNLNDESQMISRLTNAVEVTGSQDVDTKEQLIMDFTNNGGLLVTKPKIAGYGLNWQHCNKMVFIGLSDSFESFYQAIRRCWRFGQTKPVDVHIVISDREGAVLDNIKRKQAQHDQMSSEMSSVMRDLTIAEINGATVEKTDYAPIEKIQLPEFFKCA